MGGRRAKGEVGRQNSAGNRCKAGHHNAVDLALGQLVDVRTDEQGTLGHAQKDVGGRRHAFADGGAQEGLQDPAQLDHHPLHRTQIVQDGDEEAEEENHWQDGEGEDIVIHQKVAKHKEGSIGAVSEKSGHLIAQALENFAAHLPADADDTEQELGSDSGDDHAPLNGRSLGGESVAAKDEKAGCHQ